MVIHVFGTDDLAHDIHAIGGFTRVVDGGWIAANKAKVGLGPHCCSCVGDDFAHALFDEVEGLEREGAHRAAHRSVSGDHIVCAARMNLRNAQYGRFEWVAVTRNNGLQSLGNLHRRHDGVYA